MSEDLSNVSKGLKEIRDSTENMVKSIESIKTKLNNSDLAIIPPAYLPWVGTMLFLVIAGFLLGKAPNGVKVALDFITSWVTTILLIVCGITSANILNSISRKLATISSIAYAGIFTCYLAYITINYGSFEPHIAAVGFNVATSSQAILLTGIIYYIRKKGLYVGRDS